MNKFKKFMALGLAAMMVTSLVACGGSTGNAKNKKSDSSKGTTVTFWNSFTGADGDMLVKMVDKFNKENTDGIKVKMDISSDFDSQLSTAFAAGEGVRHVHLKPALAIRVRTDKVCFSCYFV